MRGQRIGPRPCRQPRGVVSIQDAGLLPPPVELAIYCRSRCRPSSQLAPEIEDRTLQIGKVTPQYASDRQESAGVLAVSFVTVGNIISRRHLTITLTTIAPSPLQVKRTLAARLQRPEDGRTHTDPLGTYYKHGTPRYEWGVSGGGGGGEHDRLSWPSPPPPPPPPQNLDLQRINRGKPGLYQRPPPGIGPGIDPSRGAAGARARERASKPV